jgi:hypothetical protein
MMCTAPYSCKNYLLHQLEYPAPTLGIIELEIEVCQRCTAHYPSTLNLLQRKTRFPFPALMTAKINSVSE